MVSLIKGLYPTLSRAERYVADLFLADPWAAIHWSIATIAARAKVSQPMVIRFCRALGYKGLADFKLATAASFGVANDPAVSVGSRRPQRSPLLAPVCDEVVQLVQLLRQRSNAASVASAIQCLCTARSVDFIGVGQAAALFDAVRSGFMTLGLPVTAFRPDEILRPSLGLHRSEVVTLLAVSGGIGPEVRRLAQALIGRGLPTITLAAMPVLDPEPGLVHLDVGPMALTGGHDQPAGLIGHIMGFQVLINGLAQQRQV